MLKRSACVAQLLVRRKLAQCAWLRSNPSACILQACTRRLLLRQQVIERPSGTSTVQTVPSTPLNSVTMQTSGAAPRSKLAIPSRPTAAAVQPLFDRFEAMVNGGATVMQLQQENQMLRVQVEVLMKTVLHKQREISDMKQAVEQLLAESSTKQKDNLKRSIVSRMCNRLVSLVFDRWCTQHRWQQHQNKRMQVVVNKIQQRQSHREMFHAVCIWHDRSVRKRVSNLCLRRWQNQTAAAAFRAWSDFRGQQMHFTRLEQHAMCHLASRIQNRHVCRALNTWHQIIIHKQLWRLVVYRWQNKIMHKAFHTWMDVAAEKHQVRHKARFLMATVASRIIHRELNRAIATWHEHTTAAHVERLVVARWQRRAECAAFQAWAWHVNEQARQRVIASRVLMRAMKRTLHAAFEGWWMSMFVSFEQRTLIRRSLGRMMHRQLTAAFTAWLDRTQSIVDERTKVLRVANGAVMRMVQRGVCSAMSAWHGAVVLRRRQARALKHWMFCQAAKAYNRWTIYTAGSRWKKRMLRQALGRLANRQLSGAFLRWLEHVSELVWRQQMVAKALVRMQCRGLARAFQAWAFVHEQYRATDARKLFVMNNTMMRWGNREMLAAIHAWHEVIVQKQVLLLVGQRWRNRATARAWNAWAACVETRRWQRLIIGGALRRMSNRHLSSSFNAWCLFWEKSVLTSTRKQYLMNTVLARMMNRELVLRSPHGMGRWWRGE